MMMYEKMGEEVIKVIRNLGQNFRVNGKNFRQNFRVNEKEFWKFFGGCRNSFQRAAYEITASGGTFDWYTTVPHLFPRVQS